jgi:hypothetical protein
MQDWRSFLARFSPALTLRDPATPEMLFSACDSLGHGLSEQLETLLTSTNGVLGEYELGLVWPISRIAADNVAFRTNEQFKELYMPFDSLLFFGDAGNGDQFALPLQGGQIRNLDVFVWNHEDDSRKWIAPSLRGFLEWWVDGKISI